MESHSPWSWTESLGGVRADDRRSYEVRRILFGLVKDRCSDLGLAVGDTVRCRHRARDGLVVELHSGARRTLELEYAWFVRVEPVGQDAEVH